MALAAQDAPGLVLPLLGITLLAGFVQGLSGFGSALLAVPLLALLWPLETVVPLMVLIGTTISAFNLAHLRHALRLGPVGLLIGGYLLGIPIGLYLLTRVPERLSLGLLGLLLSAYALAALVGRMPPSAWLRDWPVRIGVISGALGGAYSTNGPPVILHVDAQPGWSADRRKATLALFFLFSGIITALAYGIGGLIDAAVLGLFLWSTPSLLIGTLLGAWLYRHLGEHDYRRLTLALVLVTGMLLLGRALAQTFLPCVGEPEPASGILNRFCR